jgi:REP element-mobilizing transposase RayT
MGRLQHALRKAGQPTKFSRKVSVRSLGKNRRQDVEDYIDRQVQDASFVDPAFRQWLETLTTTNPNVDLSEPTESSHGRYWYNIHLVLVAEAKSKVVDRSAMVLVRDWCFKIAGKKGYAISRLSPMPDHLHIALRGRPVHSPEEIALAFLNNLAFCVGQKRIWRDGFYAGTFGEYDMGAVRR